MGAAFPDAGGVKFLGHLLARFLLPDVKFSRTKRTLEVYKSAKGSFKFWSELLMMAPMQRRMQVVSRCCCYKRIVIIINQSEFQKQRIPTIEPQKY